MGCERLALRCGAIASHSNTMCIPVSADCETDTWALRLTLGKGGASPGGDGRLTTHHVNDGW